jgi:hypothetical protein
MRQIAMIILSGVLATSPAFAQSNTTAAAAGVAAGAALAAGSGQSGTTSSSATGGSVNTPIEIQIMTFKGLQEIAHEIAKVTVDQQNDCKKARLNETEILTKDRNNLQADRKMMDAEPTKLHKDTTAFDEKTLDGDFEQLNEATKQGCAVLVEDPTSANQIALYQAVQGYHDHLQKLHAEIQPYFSLQVGPPLVTFSAPSGAAPNPQTVTLTNVVSSGPDGGGPNNPRLIQLIMTSATGNGLNPFAVNDTTSSCVVQLPPVVKYAELKYLQSCGITVTFPAAGTPAGKYSGMLSIKSGDPTIANADTVQTVQLTGTVAPLSAEDQKKEEDARKKMQSMIENYGNPHDFKLNSNEAAATTQSGASSSTGSSTGSSGTPVDLQYLSGIMTALGGIKSNITYTSSTFQPTTQAFEVMVEAELKMNGLFPYSSTSALNLKGATDALSNQFGNMLTWGNDVSTLTNQCKPTTGNGPPNGNAQSSSPSNSACTDPHVVVDLAVAQQLITAYTTLLAASNDGSGNSAIIDILRGKVLSDKMADGIPSLQVSVAAAGGNTKTNSIFGVNLFYTFAPSYNAGVIAIFELRDKNNVLQESGARNVYFNYKKSWKPGPFDPAKMKQAATCSSFCSVEYP